MLWVLFWMHYGTGVAITGPIPTFRTEQECIDVAKKINTKLSNADYVCVSIDKENF